MQVKREGSVVQNRGKEEGRVVEGWRGEGRVMQVKREGIVKCRIQGRKGSRECRIDRRKGSVGWRGEGRVMQVKREGSVMQNRGKEGQCRVQVKDKERQCRMERRKKGNVGQFQLILFFQTFKTFFRCFIYEIQLRP